MDLSTVKDWITLLVAFVALGTSVWGILSAPSRKVAQRQEEFEKDVARQIAALSSASAVNEAALLRLRDRVDGLPNIGALHELQLSMSRMEGQIGMMGERLKPVVAIAERMQDLLIEQGQK